MSETSVAIAAIGVVATSVGALIWIVKYLLGEFKKSFEDVAASNIQVAEATEKGFNKLAKSSNRMADEAKARNGHLGDMASETLKVVSETLDRLEDYAIKADKSLKKQNVREQTIEHAHIEHATIDEAKK